MQNKSLLQDSKQQNNRHDFKNKIIKLYMLTHPNLNQSTFETFVDMTKVLTEQKYGYEPEKQSEMSTTEQKAPVGKLRRKMGISVLLPPAKASDALRGNINQMDGTLKMVESLENEVREKDALLKERKGQICELGKQCEELRKENRELKERMESKEYRDEIGREVIVELFKEYLKNEKKWSQAERDNEHHRLSGFLPLSLLPQEVFDMIEGLREDKENAKGRSVNTQTYVETQNINYK